MPEFKLRRPRAAFGRNHYLSVLLTLGRERFRIWRTPAGDTGEPTANRDGTIRAW